MKIDVSDLFEHLCDVASFARARFNLSQSLDSDDYVEWNAFCAMLSDQLFLPACANRVFALTHFQLAPGDVKPRLIAEKSPENGTKTWFCRYVRPDFSERRPRFVVSHDLDGPAGNITFILTHPEHKLTLWLGKLPPSETVVNPPEYPGNLDAPIRYYSRQWFGFLSHSPQTAYYEFHGDWCLRQVEQENASFTRECLGGQWRKFNGLKEIPQEVFEAVWAAGVDSGGS